ncbi:AMP-binding protein [Sulfitobacter sediminilitoris]|uniref:AMP-binding protein n=1 Tax=Sulfitobacter sediminilitoris TaxID=2698830 RepID=UPI00361D24C1
MASNSRTGTSPDYSKALESFDLDAARSLFSGSFRDGINACVECCDAHLPDNAVALDWIAVDGHHETRNFLELRDEAARVANLLAEQGIQPGDIVAGLLPRTPDLVAVVLGALRAGAAYQPLFTAFGPKAIEDRLTMSGAKLVVTDVANREKLDGVKGCPPVALIADTPDELVAGDIDFRRAMTAQSAEFSPVLRNGDDLMLMMATSGTTGPAKGVPVPLKALPAFRSYMVEGIDLRPEDVFGTLPIRAGPMGSTMQSSVHCCWGMQPLWSKGHSRWTALMT